MNQNQHEVMEQHLDKRIKKLKKRRLVIRFIRSMVILAFTTYIAFGVVFGIGIVDGDSMNPSLKENDIILFYRWGKYKQEDLVILKKGRRTRMIKRVVGTPGESINIDDIGVWVNGELLDESYICGKTYPKTGIGFPIKLAKDKYFVLGDNRENSADSRNYGAIKGMEISGKVIVIFRIEK